jgi:hypothetical protein
VPHNYIIRWTIRGATAAILPKHLGRRLLRMSGEVLRETYMSACIPLFRVSGVGGRAAIENNQKGILKLHIISIYRLDLWEIPLCSWAQQL